MEQTIHVTIRGKKRAVHLIEQGDGSWTASTRVLVKRRAVDLEAAGTTKQEAVNKILSKASGREENPLGFGLGWLFGATALGAVGMAKVSGAFKRK